jgi:hypothetical protein
MGCPVTVMKARARVDWVMAVTALATDPFPPGYPVDGERLERQDPRDDEGQEPGSTRKRDDERDNGSSTLAWYLQHKNTCQTITTSGDKSEKFVNIQHTRILFISIFYQEKLQIYYQNILKISFIIANQVCEK